MFITIILISLSFYWLLRETDYLRIRLESCIVYQDGDCCPWHMSDDAVTDDMKQELINSWTNLPKETRVKFEQGLESPLCGWGYAYQYQNVKPEYKVELAIGGVRYNMTIKEQSIIKDVMRANHLTKKQKLAYT